MLGHILGLDVVWKHDPLFVHAGIPLLKFTRTYIVTVVSPSAECFARSEKENAELCS